MRLGTAEQIPPETPCILVLGDGLLTRQICADLDNFGIIVKSLDDLPPPDLDQGKAWKLPHPLDPDARIQLIQILTAFRTAGPNHLWVHPGVTMWSERHDFEGVAESAGVQAILPPAKALSLFTNTLSLIQRAEKLGIPNLIISDDPVFTIREIEMQVKKLFDEKKPIYPFVLKSAFRVRGGYGVRVIRQMQDLEEWVPIWLDQIRERTGEGILFLERFLEGARCYVQPFARTRSGDGELFPLVDASLQFEGKSWIDICPAQSADEHLFERIREYTEKLIDDIGYVGVGALVFYTDGVEAYLVEGLARLNFGYALWERIGRTSAVGWQLYCRAPELLDTPPRRPGLHGQGIHGINLKIYAEDPVLRLPHPGEIMHVSPEFEENYGSTEVQMQWDVKPGDIVSWNSNGSLGQLTVFAPTWNELLQSARQSIEKVSVAGTIQTNERFLFELLGHPWVEEGMFYAGFVDNEFIPKSMPPDGWLILAAGIVNELEGQLHVGESWMWMNYKIQGAAENIDWKLKEEFKLPHGRKAIIGHVQYTEIHKLHIVAAQVSPDRWVVRIQNWCIPLRRSMKGRPPQLMALVSGRVHSILVQEGEEVPARETLLIIESLEQLITHRLPVTVRVKKMNVRPEDVVVVGQELAELERIEPSPGNA